MRPKQLRISTVSYINAKPFVYGIEHSGFLSRLGEDPSSGGIDYSLSLDIPSVCAAKLKRNEVDIGLAPVAVIPELKEHFIIPDFCIGSSGAVLTVMLYSDVPLKEIKTVFLDYQSKTSSMLVQILAKKFWKISPAFVQAEEGYEKKISQATAGLIIGDRNFSLPNKFKYAYDLSAEWQLFTGLPFVFACWISNIRLEKSVSIAFHEALKYGVENKEAVVEALKGQYDEKVTRNYLNNAISYSFDKQKQTAMDLFLDLGKEIV